MSLELVRALSGYGAVPAQVVDLDRDDEPRVLRYVDLRNDPPGGSRPLVVENSGQPRVFVFDGRSATTAPLHREWCARLALRGDGAWVGVVEPGRLRIYGTRFARDTIEIDEEACADPDRPILARFVHETRGTANEVAVRRYLLRLLGRSLDDARSLGLSAGDALSLVGRGLFWRFLVDRKLLAGLSPQRVCDGATAWEQCLDTKGRALQTFEWLDRTFNGGLLPFEGTPRGFDKDAFHRVLGNIAYGATETGQLRLPTDWGHVNFAHVPVGLLSEVYEAFAHTHDAAHARETSIYYTPRHIVEFLVAEALASVPGGERPRILDPAAGAGVFLVTAFRQLAEREWRRTGERPTRQQLRRILNEQLTGFDIDRSALRLAELSLYLTALELDPSPRPLQALRFDELRGRVLFAVPAGVEHGSLGPVEERFRGKFDVVIGNPPWTANARGASAKKTWVEHTLGLVHDRLGEKRALRFDFPDTNPDLPFVWRAMEWAKPAARIALVTHARWLFGLSKRAVRARQDLLEAVHVTGILNGSALRLTKVWPNVSAPFCLLFATNERAPERAAFQFVSPLLDDPEQSRLRIDWLDADTVSVAEVLQRPWTLKGRYRGNRLAVRAVETMLRDGVSLGQYLRSLETRLVNGYQVGGAAGKKVSAKHLHGLPDLRGTRSPGFTIDVGTLPVFGRAWLYRPHRRDDYRAPLLILHESLPVDAHRPRAFVAEQDVAYDERFDGISFFDTSDGLAQARYLQIVLQSSLATLFFLLVDPQFGLEREVTHLETLRLIPVVPFDRLTPMQREQVAEITRRLVVGPEDGLASAIDAFVFELFALSRAEREAVRDTLQTALPSANSRRNAVRMPTAEERAAFASHLQKSLDAVLAASNRRAAVQARDDIHADPWRVIQIDVIARDGAVPRHEPFSTSKFFGRAADVGASLVTVNISDRTWLVGLLERYGLWTATRARLLATDLLSERSRRA